MGQVLNQFAEFIAHAHVVQVGFVLRIHRG
jgi:hypothetical protein